MAEAVYMLCALTSAACFALLLRGYLRSRTRLLLWISLCFLCLAMNNLLLCVDVMALTAHDLRFVRHAVALAGLSILLYGMIWETRSRGESRA